MRCEWTELWAAKVAAGHMNSFMTFAILDHPGMEDRHAHDRTIEMCALGYMTSLMVVDVFEGKDDPSDHLREDISIDLEEPQFPVRYFGFAGEEGETGPAYLLTSWCMESDEPRLFYSDTDIERDWDAAIDLAERIKRASSGIVGVRVEQLTSVRSIKTELEGERWCVTFAIDCQKQKGVNFEDKVMMCGYPFAILVSPKDRDHEFRLMVGEIKDNDPDNAFMLVWHTFKRRDPNRLSIADCLKLLRAAVTQRAKRGPVTFSTETEGE